MTAKPKSTPVLRVLSTKIAPGERALVQALASLEGVTPSTLVRRLLARGVVDRLSELTARAANAERVEAVR